MHTIKVGLVNFNIEQELPRFVHHQGEGTLTGWGVNARRVVYLFATGTWLDHAAIISLITPSIEPDEKKRKELLLQIFANASLSKDLAMKMYTLRASLAPTPKTEVPVPPLPKTAPPPPKPDDIIRVRDVKINHLKRYGYIACHSGNLPPHCLWQGQFNSMRVPEMNPLCPPYYSIAKLTPAVQPAYAATQPLSFYMERLGAIKKQCDDEFKKVQPLYEEFVQRFPTQGGISWRERKIPAVEETEKMADFLAKAHEKLAALQREARIQRDTIRQLRGNLNYDDPENLMVREIAGQVLSLHEASFYLKAYAEWQTEEGWLEPHVEPLNTVPKAYTIAQFQEANRTNYSAIPKIYANGPLLVFEANAKEYVRLSVWKLADGQWERIPAFIKIDENHYRYHFQAFLEPNSTYRIDQADMLRQDKDGGGEHIETVAHSAHTFIVNT